MTTFYVGQRVKKVRGLNTGKVGIVVGIASFPSGYHGSHQFYPDGFALTRPSDLQVRYDCDWVTLSGFRSTADSVAFCVAAEFEPITPSGAQPSEFTTLHELLDSLELVAA